MMPAQSRVEAGIWSVSGHEPVIEYARPVLNEILTQVAEAYDTYLAGGYEVGGALFGRREGGLVRILAFRPLQILPPRPSFMLSKSDGQRLEELIKLPASDPELEEMEAVGWYHSHTRSEIFLSEADLEIYDTHFPKPWQIAMVLHPSDQGPVRVGFFFREPDGFVRADQSYQEFAVDSPVTSTGLRKPPPWEVTPDGRVKDELYVPEVQPEEYALPPEPTPPSFWKRAGKWLLLLVALASVVAGSLSIAWLRTPEPTLGLRIQPNEGVLSIAWDPKSPALQEVSDATLIITDGSHRTEVPLGRQQLLRPAQTYQPRSARVEIRLRIRLPWNRTKEESATYLAHPNLGKPSAELLQAQKEEAEAGQDLQAARQQLGESRQTNELVQGSIHDLQGKLDELIAARKRPKRLVLPAAAPRTAAAKDLPNAPEIALRGNVAPPQLQQAPVQMRPPTEPPKPALLTPSPVPARPPVNVAPAVVPAPSPTKPPLSAATGRIIWSGDLPRDATLTIDGRKPTRGSVNGELPGGPVIVGAYPAELTNDGLRVFTGNPKYAAGKLESASAANAWQKTMYVYDPKLARELIVEQMPGPQNYKQMTIRAGSRKLSLIVIEWQAVTQ